MVLDTLRNIRNSESKREDCRDSVTPRMCDKKIPCSVFDLCVAEYEEKKEK